MSSSIDIEPSGGPLSKEYREWVFNISKDVAQLNKVRPFLEQAVKSITASGNECVRQTFPAHIHFTGSSTGAWHGAACSYDFVELLSPFDALSIKPDGRSGKATNTMEFELNCGSSAEDFYLPPGIDKECLNLTDDDTEWPEEDANLNCFRVGHRGDDEPSSAIVTMHETIATESWHQGWCQPVEEGQPFYYFCVPISFCIRCDPIGPAP